MRTLITAAAALLLAACTGLAVAPEGASVPLVGAAGGAETCSRFAYAIGTLAEAGSEEARIAAHVTGVTAAAQRATCLLRSNRISVTSSQQALGLIDTARADLAAWRVAACAWPPGDARRTACVRDPIAAGRARDRVIATRGLLAALIGI